MNYKIVYPESRLVDEDTIRVWYADACSNREVDYPDLTAIDDVMAELESCGHVTFEAKRG
jgi:hypothetical protein